MKGFKRSEKGFTLVELLIVVAILGILAAVVIPNVVGLMGRGGAQAYKTDNEVIQLASAAFYSDVHGGFINDGTAADSLWGCTDPAATDLQDSGHYYPTALGFFGDHEITLDPTSVDPDHVNNFQLVIGAGNATDQDIADAAIWMGLLVNAPGDGVSLTGVGGLQYERGEVSVLLTDTGLYLQTMPKSAATDGATADKIRNGAPAPGGGYCWVVGKNGTVYGAYTLGTDKWYAGFSGAYP